MIDLEYLIKSLRLVWLKRNFIENNETYLQHLLKPRGGLFFLNWNYDIKHYNICSQFYIANFELLFWWSDFRNSFASESEWQNIIWNKLEVRIGKRAVFRGVARISRRGGGGFQIGSNENGWSTILTLRTYKTLAFTRRKQKTH